MASDDAVLIEIAGKSVPISSPGKVFFSERGETKLDLVSYYTRVEEPLMRTMRGRPALLQRFPDGAEGNSFFQKRVPRGAPEWLETTIVTTPNGTTSRALVIADLAHVVWAVNLGCLGFHTWPYQWDSPGFADELRIDLDPQPGVTFDEVRAAARDVKTLLDELGVRGYPKTTGSRGLHIYVRLAPRWDSYQVRSAALAAGRELERRRPTSSPRRGGRKSAAAACSSTSTRTLRTRQFSPHGRCARAPVARYRPLYFGTRSTRWSRTS